jgi:hypothetical protein
MSIVFGFLFTEYFNAVRTAVESVIYSLVSGVIGAMLVIYLKRAMLVLAAAFAGWYICLYLPPALEMDTAWISLPVLALAALVGGVATLMWGSLPVILISAVMGATLIIQQVRFGAISNLAMFLVLCLFGLIAQFVLFQYTQAEPD